MAGGGLPGAGRAAGVPRRGPERSGSMHFAVSFNPTDLSMNVLELGRAVEERGFETLFFPEHTHLPVGGTSQYPYGPELSPLYRRT